ncbi:MULTISPECIES: LysR family transcriptional regulator [Mycolicibacterium]|uniref:Probable hydrogen peroxide-inducible genes activator n=1 Tax=Mycolicibacterium senegalense TaxID=1796 RepID=A0A378SW21_9MYCO|nr:MULTISPECIES: LysR family transcriptional regulator [Mycolicibacterium]MCV7334215.1 LysR family transcriptional regulator [Mycolicibacterium senegalense]MDR7292271.1 DNA-binding transcriptional LysR family regulator [Mycolicibacterium senegalense]QZA23655.1 LysR family transcriptional regulator [Mycolicibacterium senegalense]CDP88512.1 LysR family transcriptional regulator [Mycolicibacterium farcinogenes]STZ52541.1 LysR family transcriptional regulator [Mycolicibacterium senegalense]
MTLNQLRAFLEAERLGSFTAAAEALTVAQASVSELVRRLEEELDAQLFVRGSRRLALTAAGQELLPYAQQAVHAADGGVHAVRSLGSLGGGTATFGVPRNADYYLLSSLVQTFHMRYPDVRVRLVGQNSAETAAAIQDGEIEAGLLILPIDDEDLKVRPLLRDEVFYISAEPAHTAQPVTIQQFAQRKLVLYDAHYGWKDPTRRQLAERAQLAGLRLEPMIEIEHVEAALKLVADNVGDTIASGAVIGAGGFPAGLHIASFAEPLYDVIALAQHRARPLSNATREFARLAEDTIRELRTVDPGAAGEGESVPLISRPRV